MADPSPIPHVPTLPTLQSALDHASTPLLRSALAFTRAHSTPTSYNHVLRSWLFAVLIAPRIPSPSPTDDDNSTTTTTGLTIDPEVLGLATILHDLGWDTPANGLTSPDKRFEVDGANAAVTFLARTAPSGWDVDGDQGDGPRGGNGVLQPHGYHGRKTQQIWDAIALHTTGTLAFQKEPPVAAAAYGIWADFQGPEHTVPAGVLGWDEYDGVVAALPRLGLMAEVKEIMCGLCVRKPATTWDNTVGEWGERFVEGYTREGHTAAEMLLRCDLDEREG